MDRDNIKLNCERKEASSDEKQLSPVALRALAEAEQRRTQTEVHLAKREIGGRGGHDPARFGDWEIKGRAIDF